MRVAGSLSAGQGREQQCWGTALRAERSGQGASQCGLTACTAVRAIAKRRDAQHECTAVATLQLERHQQQQLQDVQTARRLGYTELGTEVDKL